MTARATHSTQIPVALMVAGIGSLCCVGNAAEAAGPTNGFAKYAPDVAWEVAQMVAPEPIDSALKTIDTVKDTAATVAGVATASAVIGSSGPAILSTLSAAGGPVTTGALSGFGVAGLQNKYLYSDCDNSTACDAASVAGYVGAGAGMASAAALGATYGVGATGLAAIGGMVGGGMAVGAAGLIALPALGAVAIGAGVYGLVSWFSN